MRTRVRRLAGGGAVLTLVGLQLWPHTALGAGGSGDDLRAVLPTQLPAYSHLNGTVEGAPAGPALMAFAHGLGVEFLDHPQAAVLGADGRSYRQVRTAERASAAQDQGDPAPFLLSPDGTTLAVGSNGGTGRLAVVDLSSGEVYDATVRRGSSTSPVAWSADGSRLFVAVTDGPVNPHGPSGQGPGDGLVRLDSTAGYLADPVALPGVAGAVAALPDGRVLVTQGRRTELRTPDGQTVLVPDTGLPPHISSTAVSPDGGRVAGYAGAGTVWVGELDADGVAGQRVSWSLGGHHVSSELLGWLDDDSLLVSTYHDEAHSVRLRLRSLDADTGAGEEISAAEPGWTGAAITRVSVAADLLDGVAVAEVRTADRATTARLLGMLSWTVLAVLGLGLVRRGAARLRAGPVPG